LDIVIPFGKASKQNETALHYCLKSINKFVEHNAIFIIGEKSNLIPDFVYLPFKERENISFISKNIFDKIAYACSMDYVSDPFLLVFDDYIFLRPYTYTLFHSGPLTTDGFSTYQNFYHTLKNTMAVVGNANRFAAHCPLLIDKKLFANIDVDWQKPHGYDIKTLYCNINNLQGEYHKDLKLRNQQSKEAIYNFIKDEPLFSLPATVNKFTAEVLKELFD
jgi:hypothetical protein